MFCVNVFVLLLLFIHFSFIRRKYTLFYIFHPFSFISYFTFFLVSREPEWPFFYYILISSILLLLLLFYSCFSGAEAAFPFFSLILLILLFHLYSSWRSRCTCRSGLRRRGVLHCVLLPFCSPAPPHLQPEEQGIGKTVPQSTLSNLFRSMIVLLEHGHSAAPIDFNLHNNL